MSSLRKRRHGVEDSCNLIRRHLAVLQATHLTALSQSLEADGDFPALAFVDEEDVFLAVGVTDRCAENMEMLGRLLAGLEIALA